MRCAYHQYISVCVKMVAAEQALEDDHEQRERDVALRLLLSLMRTFTFRDKDIALFPRRTHFVYNQNEKDLRLNDVH